MSLGWFLKATFWAAHATIAWIPPKTVLPYQKPPVQNNTSPPSIK